MQQAPSPNAGADDASGLLRELRDGVTALIDRLTRPQEQPSVPDPFTNEEVLPHAHGRHAPTLHDVHKANQNSWWLSLDTEKKDGFQKLFLYIRNFAFLKELRHSTSLHQDLPTMPGHARAEYHDVWVLCPTRSTAVESFRHWSVMTQGHMFHLSADKSEGRRKALQFGRVLGNASVKGGKPSMQNVLREVLAKDPPAFVPIDVNHRDFSKGTRDWMDDKEKEKNGKRRRYIAYHVGHTRYTPDDIHRLSVRIMAHMREVGIGSYDMLRNNCQHFVVSLVRRIVMTQREPKAVAGTRLELAEWNCGEPGYDLKKWLTKWKARALFLPTQLTEEFPKKQLPMMSFLPSVLHDDRTIGRFLHSMFHDRSQVGESLKAVFTKENKREHLVSMFKNHIGGHVKWRKYDGKSLLGWGTSMFHYRSILLLDEMLAAIGAASAEVVAVALEAAIPIAGTATFLASLPVEEILIVGFLTYFVTMRTMYARGSLTVVHWDIKRPMDPKQKVPFWRRKAGSGDGVKRVEVADRSELGDLENTNLDDGDGDGDGDEGDDEKYLPLKDLESLLKGDLGEELPPYDLQEHQPALPVETKVLEISDALAKPPQAPQAMHYAVGDTPRPTSIRRRPVPKNDCEKAPEVPLVLRRRPVPVSFNREMLDVL